MKNMLHAQKLPLVLSFALLAGLATQSIAQTTVFSDDFTDNNRDGWHMFNSESTRSLDASGGTLDTVSNSSFNYWGALTNFSQIDLASDGDFISLSFSFQMLTTPTNAVGFGLYNSGGTQLSADATDYGVTGNDTGYWYHLRDDRNYLVTSNGGLGLTSVNWSGVDVVKRNVANDANIFANPAEGRHTANLTIVRAGAGVEVTLLLDAGETTESVVASEFVPTTVITSFDQISFSMLRRDASIDDVLVTTNVPEPSSFALLAGMLALTSVMVRRRG